MQSHEALRHAINNCALVCNFPIRYLFYFLSVCFFEKRNLPRPVRPFTPPALQKSKAAYAMTEIHFLWTNLSYLRLPLGARTGENEVFVYNSQQLEALSELDRILSLEGRVQSPWCLQSKIQSIIRALLSREDYSVRTQPLCFSAKSIFSATLFKSHRVQRTFCITVGFSSTLIQGSIFDAAGGGLTDSTSSWMNSRKQDCSKGMRSGLSEQIYQFHEMQHIPTVIHLQRNCRPILPKISSGA